MGKVAALAPAVAAELLDAGINMGSATATRFLQRALNALNRGGRDYRDVPVDGEVGAGTLTALAAFARVRGAGGEAVLVKAMQGLRAAAYVTIAEGRPANEAFLYGWLANRTG